MSALIRIRVIGGPWPERIGRTGHVVPDPGDGVYPFDKRATNERVVKLDDDPLKPSARWSCVYRVRDLEFIT